MLRLLVLIALALWIAWWVDRGLRRLRAWLGTDLPGGSTGRRHGRDRLRGGELVRCAACGVHVPRDRAVVARASFYCSETCRRKPSP